MLEDINDEEAMLLDPLQPVPDEFHKSLKGGDRIVEGTSLAGSVPISDIKVDSLFNTDEDDNTEEYTKIETSEKEAAPGTAGIPM